LKAAGRESQIESLKGFILRRPRPGSFAAVGPTATILPRHDREVLHHAAVGMLEVDRWYLD